MKKEKGFTLIELLAVIVVLAIILVITIPTVLNSMQNAREKSVQNIVRIAEDWGEKQYKLAQVHPEQADELFQGGEMIVTLETEEELKKLGYSSKDITSVRIVIDVDGRARATVIFPSDGKFGTGQQRVCESTGCIKPYVEEKLNGSDPDLDPGMIPIKIASNGIVTKANLEEKWYDYSEKQWANAVLVNSATRYGYQQAAPETPIDEDDILAYFVWIPRYKYKLFNVEGNSISPRAIEIEFENNKAEKSNGITNGSNLTHPAFTYGDIEVNGFWVGKFEPSAEKGSACDETPSAANCNNLNIEPRIKPNEKTLRYQSVSTQFQTALKMGNKTLNIDGTVTNHNDKSTYGLVSEARMMKNTEWGAVAYLSHSRYGINKEIAMNSCSENYITGIGDEQENWEEPESWESNTACEDPINQYNGEIGKTASTTGNITGIYDMNGGAWENVMGVREDTSGNPRSGYSMSINSGFNGSLSSGSYSDGISFPASKYYDLYSSSRIDGDATTETRGWYGDYASFVNSSSPWFQRGGDSEFGFGAGAFTFRNLYGGSSLKNSFRLVVSPAT